MPWLRAVGGVGHVYVVYWLGWSCYRFYRYGCGRDARLQAIWGDGHS